MSHGDLLKQMAGQRWAILLATLVGMTATFFPWKEVDGTFFAWKWSFRHDGGDAGLSSLFLFAGALTCALLGEKKRFSLSGLPLLGVIAFSALATLNALGAVLSVRDTANQSPALEWVYRTGLGANLALFAGVVTLIFAVVFRGGGTPHSRRGERRRFGAWKRNPERWSSSGVRSSAGKNGHASREAPLDVFNDYSPGAPAGPFGNHSTAGPADFSCDDSPGESADSFEDYSSSESTDSFDDLFPNGDADGRERTDEPW